MVKESKSKKFRTSSSKEKRANSGSKPRLQSSSSQKISIKQVIEQNNQNIKDMQNRRQFLIKMKQQIQSQKQSQFKKEMINSYKAQIQIIEEGIQKAEICREKLTILWMAEIKIQSQKRFSEFQQLVQNKKKKRNKILLPKERIFKRRLGLRVIQFMPVTIN